MNPNREKFVFPVFVALLIAIVAGAAFADRTDSWSAASVRVFRVDLNLLADGGCSVQAQATYTKADGGVISEVSAETEVAGVNRTSCLDILSTKAPVLFKNDKGL